MDAGDGGESGVSFIINVYRFDNSEGAVWIAADTAHEATKVYLKNSMPDDIEDGFEVTRCTEEDLDELLPSEDGAFTLRECFDPDSCGAQIIAEALRDF